MKLEILWPVISDFAHLLIMVPICTGTKENFEVEIVRGGRKAEYRTDFLDWLFSLGLEVESISCCGQDTCGNKELLCIHCKPIVSNPKQKGETKNA